MGPKFSDELFYKWLKLFCRGAQVTSLNEIYRSNLIFELECSKYGNSNIQLEI